LIGHLQRILEYVQNPIRLHTWNSIFN